MQTMLESNNQFEISIGNSKIIDQSSPTNVSSSTSTLLFSKLIIKRYFLRGEMSFNKLPYSSMA